MTLLTNSGFSEIKKCVAPGMMQSWVLLSSRQLRDKILSVNRRQLDGIFRARRERIVLRLPNKGPAEPLMKLDEQVPSYSKWRVRD